MLDTIDENVAEVSLMVELDVEDAFGAQREIQEVRADLLEGPHRQARLILGPVGPQALLIPEATFLEACDGVLERRARIGQAPLDEALRVQLAVASSSQPGSAPLTLPLEAPVLDAQLVDVDLVVVVRVTRVEHFARLHNILDAADFLATSKVDWHEVRVGEIRQVMVVSLHAHRVLFVGLLRNANSILESKLHEADLRGCRHQEHRLKAQLLALNVANALNRRVKLELAVLAGCAVHLSLRVEPALRVHGGLPQVQEMAVGDAIDVVDEVRAAIERVEALHRSHFLALLLISQRFLHVLDGLDNGGGMVSERGDLELYWVELEIGCGSAAAVVCSPGFVLAADCLVV